MKMIRSYLVGLVLVLFMTYMAYDTFYRLLLQYPQQCKNDQVDHHNDNHGAVVAYSIIVEHVVYAVLVCWCCYSYLTHVPNCHGSMNEPDGHNDDGHTDIDSTTNNELDTGNDNVGPRHRRHVPVDVATLVPLGTVRLPQKRRSGDVRNGHNGHNDHDNAQYSDRESSTMHDGNQPSWTDDSGLSGAETMSSSSSLVVAVASKASDRPRIVMAESTITVDFPLSTNASCPVCLEDYRDGDRVSLGGAHCHHILHAHCLHQWIRATTTRTGTTEAASSRNNLQAAPATTAATCPSCRQDLW